MNLSFTHNNLRHLHKGTIAISLPTKDDLNNLFNLHGTATLVCMGVGMLHPHDRFEKSVGRAIAVHNLNWVTAYLTQVEIRGTSHIFHFTTTIKSVDIDFGLSIIKETDDVRLIYGNIEKNQGDSHASCS